ncbi:MAG: lipid-A-disaccharide synthase [Candidatus Schmidhempelia sp.]|nr:lipid-A-disaccharide synthase [Candidatus Schmidhempelia sp.]
MIDNKLSLTIALVAGETSGDILGAGLIYALKQRYPDIHFHFIGIAGPRMQNAGCEAFYEMEELSVMGIVEVLGKLRRILTIRKQITQKLIALKPDIFIGIDAPDFNLRLEGNLKKAGIKTVHYVSPSVWAWKQKRVFKIKKNTDLMLTFLPFEKAFYDKYRVNCRFIGHKMADDIPLEPDHLAARKTLNIPPEEQCLALLPGSRHAEVTLLSGPFIRAAQLLRQYYPNLHIIVPLVNSKRRHEFETIKQQIAPDLPLTLLDGQAREALIASNVALLASGTVALEAMLCKCPMVVAYKMKPFTFWLAKKVVKTPYISLPNILAGKAIVAELLQDECNPNNIIKFLLPLLEQDNQALKQQFIMLHQQIRCHADEQAADAVFQLIQR